MSGPVYRFTTRFVPTFAVFALGMGLAHAGSVYWDTNGATAGSGAATGTWGTDTFWSTNSGGTIAPTVTTTASTDDLFFSAGTTGTTGTVTVNGIQFAHSITFDDPVVVTLSGGTIDLGSATAGSGIFVTAAANDSVSSAITLDSAATAIAISNTSTGVVTFNGNVTGAATAGIQTLTLTNTSTGTVTVSGNIGDGSAGGSVALSKTGTGAGIATLSGTNTYTGVTTISGGTLQFAKRVSLYNADTTKWTAANLPVSSGATVAFNVGGSGEFTTGDVTTLLTNLLSVNNNGLKAGSFIGFDTTNASPTTFTISNVIGNSTGTGGGAVGVVKLGTNTLALTGVNTYTGGTMVNGGTVNVSNDQSAANGGWATANSVTINFQSGSTVQVASGKSITIGSGTSGSSTLNVAGTVINAGSLTASRAAVVINSGGDWTQSGLLTISSGSATSFTGSLTVNTGGKFTYTGGSNITVNPSPNSSGAAKLTISGGTFITGKGFTIGNTTGTGRASLTLSNGGILQLSASLAALVTTVTNDFDFTLGTGGGAIDTNTFSTAIAQNLVNISGQTGSLIKAGNGKLTLSGANNTYTGATTVNGGTLVVSGSLNGTANVNVGSSGTLASGVTGSITTAAAGNISVSGTLAPGDLGTVGTLTLAPGAGGQLSFTSGSTLALDISGTNADQITFSSAGDWLLGSSNVALTLSGLTAADYGNTYTVFHNVSTSGFAVASISGYDTTNYVANFTQVGSDYQLSFTAIPEPSATISLLGGLGVLLAWRRRKGAARI